MVRIRRGADLVGAGLFAVLFLALVVQVVRRLVFDAPAAWTEELAAIAFIWVIFWGAAFTVPLPYHAAVDPLVPLLPARARRPLYAIGLAALACAFLVALPGSVDYVAFMLRERTPVLEWTTAYVYSVFPVFALAAAVRCVAGIARPPRGDGSPER